MSYEVRITAQAEEDLRKIYKYIAEDLQSPINAKSLLDRLETAIMKLTKCR